MALLVNVIKGVTQKVHIIADDKADDRVITLACACNGRFYGGGFNPVPEAEPDDGLLDFLIVGSVSRLKVAQIVGKYAGGNYREFPELISHRRGTDLTIEADKEFVVNIDGEIINTKSVSFKVIPSGINFLFPQGM